jgi:hypothetical protein
MRRISFPGYRVEVDDGSGIFTWRITWYYVLLACLIPLLFASLFLYVPIGVLVAGLRGQVSGGEALVGLQRVAWWGVVVFFWAMFTFMFLAGVLTIRHLPGLVLFGTAPYVLDRWYGRFRLGRRVLCGLDRISAVCLVIGHDAEEGDWYTIHFRLKNGPDLPLRHMGRFALKDENAGRFVAELAGFLGVPVVKAARGGPKDPFAADLVELLADLAVLLATLGRFLGVPPVKATPVKSKAPVADFEGW